MKASLPSPRLEGEAPTSRTRGMRNKKKINAIWVTVFTGEFDLQYLLQVVLKWHGPHAH